MVRHFTNARLLRRVAVVASALSLLAACNVIHLRQRSYERQLQSAGLQPHTDTFGADTLSYWAGGRGRTVLFLHGMGPDAIWQWHDGAAALATRCRVVMPDLLWFGASTSTEADYSLDHQVRAVVGLLDHLDAAEVDVVGLSYGGLVALQLALQHPERVRKLVIVDSPATVYSEEDHAAALQRLHIARLEDLLVPSGEADVRALLALAYADPPFIPDFAARQMAEEMTARNQEQKVALLRWVTDNMEALKAKATTPTQPTLLIWGEGDPLFPLSVGRRLATTWSAPLQVIGQARHAPNIEFPDLVNKIVLPFLE